MTSLVRIILIFWYINGVYCQIETCFNNSNDDAILEPNECNLYTFEVLLESNVNDEMNSAAILLDNQYFVSIQTSNQNNGNNNTFIQLSIWNPHGNIVINKISITDVNFNALNPNMLMMNSNQFMVFYYQNRYLYYITYTLDVGSQTLIKNQCDTEETYLTDLNQETLDTWYDIKWIGNNHMAFVYNQLASNIIHIQVYQYNNDENIFTLINQHDMIQNYSNITDISMDCLIINEYESNCVVMFKTDEYYSAMIKIININNEFIINAHDSNKLQFLMYQNTPTIVAIQPKQIFMIITDIIYYLDINGSISQEQIPLNSYDVSQLVYNNIEDLFIALSFNAPTNIIYFTIFDDNFTLYKNQYPYSNENIDTILHFDVQKSGNLIILNQYSTMKTITLYTLDNICCYYDINSSNSTEFSIEINNKCISTTNDSNKAILFPILVSSAFMIALLLWIGIIFRFKCRKKVSKNLSQKKRISKKPIKMKNDNDYVMLSDDMHDL